MAEFGKFTELTFVNGASPPINADNLNELERVVALTDSELQRSQTVVFSDYAELMYNNNTKLINAFTDVTEWTNAYSWGDLEDTDYYNVIGPSAIKQTEDDDTASFIGMYQNLSSALDLTKFNDGSASVNDDCIVMLFYINSVAYLNEIQVRMGDDFSNCYYIEFSGASLSNGWNCVYPQKSDFTTIGSPTGWNSIDYLRHVYLSLANGNTNNLFVVWQLTQLVRQDPVYSGYQNFSQLEQASGYENYFNIIVDPWSLVRDVSINVNSFGFMFLNSSDSVNALTIYEDCLDFVSKVEMYPKHAGVTATIAWYVDSNNYVELYVNSNILTLNVYESGVLVSTTTDTFTSSLLKNEKIYLYLEKRGQNIKGMARKGGERLRYVNDTTSISANTSGDVRLGGHTQYCQTLITDISVSHSLGSLKLADRNIFTTIQKKETQNFTTNVLADVDDMLVKLEPNSIYEIQCHLSANNQTSAAADIKIAWSSSGSVSTLILRHCLGPSTSMTDRTNTTMRVSVSFLTTNLAYGIEGSGIASTISETFLVKTEQDGGIIQLQAAQNTVDGSITTLSSNCYISARKVS